jgi:protocatechuate 3,4-dioxygenase beta subunit
VTSDEPVHTGLAAVLATCATARPWAEQDEGPYHLERQPHRRNVVEDRRGATLQLGIRLVHGTAPVGSTDVEIWQCDAVGRYSGFPPQDTPTADEPAAEYSPGDTFLRGRQTTDDAGMAEFWTIYPGWYPGRTVHIHLTVHAGLRVLTTQLYFPDDTTDTVLATAPYRDRPYRDTTNTTDTILPTGGDPAIVDVTQTAHGYRAVICLGLADPPPG